MGIFSKKSDKKPETKKTKTKEPDEVQDKKEPENAVVDDGMVDAIAAKEFTSTIFGNVTKGKTLNITKQRYETWLSQGMVEEIE